MNLARYRFVLSRPLQLLPVLLGISLITFVLGLSCRNWTIFNTVRFAQFFSSASPCRTVHPQGS